MTSAPVYSTKIVKSAFFKNVFFKSTFFTAGSDEYAAEEQNRPQCSLH